MPVVTEWLYWYCHQCRAKGITVRIRGDKKNCPECEHQQGHDERMEMEGLVNNDPPNPEDIITDSATLERVARPGTADWWCDVCDQSVVFDAPECPTCGVRKGATLEEIHDLKTFRGVRQSLREGGVDRAVLVAEHGPMEGREALAGRGRGSGLDDAAVALGGGFTPRGSQEAVDPEDERLVRAFRPVFRIPRFSMNDIEPKHIAIAIGVVFAILLTWFLVWGFSTYDVEGKVSELSWEHREKVERFTQVRKEDWEANISRTRPAMPVNGTGERAGAENVACSMRHHHYEQYQCGTKTVNKSRPVADGQDCRMESVSYSESVPDGQDCRTTSRNCTSNSNGSRTCTGGDRVCTPRSRSVTKYRQENRCSTKYRTEYYTVEEPKYCDRSIERSYCSYTTYVWQQVAEKTHTGSGHETTWPNLGLGVHDRRRRDATYTVTVVWQEDGKQKSDSETMNWSEYQSWKVGDPIYVAVRNFGGSAGIRRRAALEQK